MAASLAAHLPLVLDLREAHPELGEIPLQLLHLVGHASMLRARVLAEPTQGLPYPTSDPPVVFPIETAPERAAGPAVPEHLYRPHHGDAEMGVTVLEQFLQVLADFAVV